MTERYVAAVSIKDSIDKSRDYYKAFPIVQHIRRAGSLLLDQGVTFFVGENGTGKSTLLEAIAVAAGFNAEGGTRNFNFATQDTHSGLHDHLRLVRGVRRPKSGFFLRAESFYNVASEVDRLDKEDARPLLPQYGGKSLHAQSHGESFMALARSRFGPKGLYILDEPEAALSPSRQMALLSLLHRTAQQGAQYIIATHAPILMTCPGATIYQFSQRGIETLPFAETEHYLLTKRFLEAPASMLRALLDEEESDLL